MNRRNAFPPSLPLAPIVYDREYINKLVRVLNAYATDSTTPGDLVGASLLLIGPAQTGYGLVSGAAWVDENGFLRLVRDGDVFAPSTYMRMSPGQVTVSV